MIDILYANLVEAILQKQASVLGTAVTVRRARNVAGLEVDDSGKVTRMPPNAQPALEQLVEQFQALSGSMGVDFCKQAAASYRRVHPEVLLPAIFA